MAPYIITMKWCESSARAENSRMALRGIVWQANRRCAVFADFLEHKAANEPSIGVVL